MAYFLASLNWGEQVCNYFIKKTRTKGKKTIPKQFSRNFGRHKVIIVKAYIHQVRKLRFVRHQVTLVSLSILNEQKETNFMELLIFKISTLCHVIRDTSFDKGKMKYVQDLIQTICLYRRDNKKKVSNT